MKRDSVQLTGATIPMTLGLNLSKHPKHKRHARRASKPTQLQVAWAVSPAGSVSRRTAGFGIQTDRGVTPPIERTPQSVGGSDHEHGGT